MKRIRKYKNQLSALATVFLMICCIIFREDVKAGFTADLSFCVQTILPALFPMLTAASFLTRTGLPVWLQTTWQLTVGAAAGTPGACVPASFFGFTAGYPLGIKTTALLFRSKRICIKEAQTLAYACVHPGVAFCVFVVGHGMFHSVRLGWTLFFSVLAADLVLSRLARILLKPRAVQTAAKQDESRDTVTSALPAAVESAIRSILGICGWILLCGACKRIAEHAAPQWFSAILTTVLEVTNGAIFAAQTGSAPLCAFVLGFGGLSVFLQLLKELDEMGIPPIRFLLGRMFAGCLAALFEWSVLKLLPPAAIQTYAVTILPSHADAGTAGSLALMLLCFVFMADISAGKSKSRADFFKSKIFRF